MPENTLIERVIIDRVRPEIDAGRFPIKRTVGEKVKVRADILTDGHDALLSRFRRNWSFPLDVLAATERRKTPCLRSAVISVPRKRLAF